jgi:rhodanese-related sulfurtransferase
MGCPLAKPVFLQALCVGALGIGAGMVHSMVTSNPVRLTLDPGVGIELPTPVPGQAQAGQEPVGQTPGATVTPGVVDAPPAPTIKNPQPRPTGNAQMVDLETLTTLLQSGDAQLVDARSAAEFATGHIASAVQIAFEDFQGRNPPAMDTLDRSRNVIVYCGGGSCDASILVAQQLALRGFTKIAVFKDGVEGWKAAGLPLVGPDGQPIPAAGPSGGGGGAP